MTSKSEKSSSDIRRLLKTPGVSAQYDVEAGFRLHKKLVEQGTPAPEWANEPGAARVSTTGWGPITGLSVVAGVAIGALWYAQIAGNKLGSVTSPAAATHEVARSAPPPSAPPPASRNVSGASATTRAMVEARGSAREQDKARGSAREQNKADARLPVHPAPARIVAAASSSRHAARRQRSLQPAIEPSATGSEAQPAATQGHLDDSSSARAQSAASSVPEAEAQRTATPSQPDHGSSERSQESAPSSAPNPSSPLTGAGATQLALPDVDAGQAEASTEVQQLALAERLLAREPARALALVRAGMERFRPGYLHQERRYVEVLALIALSQRAPARQLARQFVRDYPASPYRRKVEQAIAQSAAVEARGSATEKNQNEAHGSATEKNHDSR